MGYKPRPFRAAFQQPNKLSQQTSLNRTRQEAVLLNRLFFLLLRQSNWDCPHRAIRSMIILAAGQADSNGQTLSHVRPQSGAAACLSIHQESA
jgi:hypothetical protein